MRGLGVKLGKGMQHGDCFAVGVRCVGGDANALSSTNHRRSRSHSVVQHHTRTVHMDPTPGLADALVWLVHVRAYTRGRDV
jgi:hypothetical protein